MTLGEDRMMVRTRIGARILVRIETARELRDRGISKFNVDSILVLLSVSVRVSNSVSSYGVCVGE